MNMPYQEISLPLAEEKTITVIGAGLAGLTAAYRIEQITGLPVSIYEARERPGGRVYTIELGDLVEELGGKFVTHGVNPKNILPLMDELGLKLEPYPPGSSHPKFIFKGEELSYNETFLKGPIPNEMTFSRLLEIGAEAKNLGEVLDLILEHPPLRHLIELQMKNYEGNETKELDSAYIHNFWEIYKKEYDKARTGIQHLSQLDQIQGGSSRLVERLVATLSQPIHYRSPLRKIFRSSSNGKINLQFDGGKTGSTDLLILAVPCSTLKSVQIEEGLFPEDQKKAIETLQYGTNAKLLIPVTGMRPFTLFGRAEEAVFWFNKEGSILTYYYGGKEGDFEPSEIPQKMETALLSLKKLYPDLSFSTPVGISWVHEEFSKGSYANWGVDQWEFFNEKEVHRNETVRKVFRPIDDQIFFSGEHTSLESSGFMEGAVESGERTARMIIQSL